MGNMGQHQNEIEQLNSTENNVLEDENDQRKMEVLIEHGAENMYTDHNVLNIVPKEEENDITISADVKVEPNKTGFESASLAGGNISCIVAVDYDGNAPVENTVVKMENTEEEHKCDVCSATFRDVERLLIHKETHPLETTNQCTIHGSILTHEEESNLLSDSIIQSSTKRPDENIAGLNEKHDKKSSTKASTIITVIIPDGKKSAPTKMVLKPSYSIEEFEDNGTEKRTLVYAGLKNCNMYGGAFQTKSHHGEVVEEPIGKHFRVETKEPNSGQALTLQLKDKKGIEEGEVIGHQVKHEKLDYDAYEVGDNRQNNKKEPNEETTSILDDTVADQDQHNGRENDETTARDEEGVSEPCECAHCGEWFRQHADVMAHIQIHHNDENTNMIAEEDNKSICQEMLNSYRCGKCGMCFSHPESLTMHIIAQHVVRNQAFQCKQCGKYFSQLADMTAHVKKLHVSENPKRFQPVDGDIKQEIPQQLECRQCGRCFREDTDLTTHICQHLDENQYKGQENTIEQDMSKQNQCVMCGQSFKWSAQLGNHKVICEKTQCGKCFSQLIQEDVMKPYECGHCGVRFSQDISLTRHIKTHHNEGETPNKCKTCYKSLSWISLTLEHMEEISYSCDQCTMSFCDENILTVHKKLHVDETKVHKCYICSFTYFADKQQMLTHMLNKHANLKAYICTFCNELFTELQTLKVHLPMHDDDDVVPALYDQVYVVNDLRKHPVTYSAGKPQQCKQSDEPFADKEQSATDIETDDKKSSQTERDQREPVEMRHKRYHCDICKFIFVSETYLLLHKLRHAGVKRPFQCSICERSFQYSSALTYHMLVHAGEKPRCSVCGKTFSVKSSLIRHMRLHPGELTPCKCNLCGELFESWSQRATHMQVHQRPCICNICGESFVSGPHRATHMKVHYVKPQCNVCGKSLSSEQSLTQHMRRHTGEKPYQCNICGESFATSSRRAVHLRKQHIPNHDNIKLLCNVCGKSFSTKGNLKEHMRIHSGEKPYHCNICGKSFVSLHHRASHMIVHTDERPYECDLCGKALKCLSNLKKHKRLHTEKPCTCDLCGKVFMSQYEIREHTREHKSGKHFQCKECGKRVDTKIILKKHMCTHSGEARKCKVYKPFAKKGEQCELSDDKPLAGVEQQCELGDGKPLTSVEQQCELSDDKPLASVEQQCELSDDKPFAKKEQQCEFSAGKPLASMEQQYELTGEKPCKCKICGESFVSGPHRDAHIQVHNGKSQCNVCGKSLSSEATLMAHMRRHKGEKPYQCNICRKSFVSSSQRASHRNSVHSVKQQCSVCGKSYSCKGNLKLHMRIHKGEKSYHCNICGKTLISSSNRASHMLVHTEKRPHVCHLCGKAFKCLTNLKVHKRSHTGEKPYTCDLCGKAYMFRHKLKEHTRTHTGEKDFHCKGVARLTQWQTICCYAAAR